MLTRIARFVVRRRKPVLIAALVLLVIAGAFGGNVEKHLSNGGFQDPNAESTRADALIQQHFDQGDPNLVLLITAKNGNIDDPAVVAAGQALTDELATTEGILQSVSYWSLGSPPPLKSKNGDQALLLARIAGTDDEIDDLAGELTPKIERDTDVITVEAGGFAEVFNQVGKTIKKDLTRAESVAFPLTLLLLILVFGSVIAAGLPLGLGVIAIIGTFFALRVIASLTQVSVYSINLTTGMGLGLAIDYSLFIVSRFREELRNGLDPDNAVIRTIETAGKTVLFSALTVAASLSALLVFPLAFLRSFAYAGISVVLIAAVGSVMVVGAALALLGRRVDGLSLFRRRREYRENVEEGFWHRAALAVMKRPVVFGVSVIIVLLVLGAPFFNIRFGLPDDRVLPENHPGRVVQDEIRANFNSSEAGAASIVAARPVDANAEKEPIAAFAAGLSQIKNVSRVDAPTGSYIGGQKVLEPTPLHARFVTSDWVWMSAIPTIEPNSIEGEKLVKAVRSYADEQAPFPILVGGPSAMLLDSKTSLFAVMPLALAIIAIVTLVLLFMMFGSILVPIKAIILNLLSLTATFGAMVWVFQEGHLSGFLNFTPGDLDTTTPILMFCVAFGLSMDYEVFLLSRIKEEHDISHDNTRSVAIGLEKTGRIVTAAAALLAVVFLAFVTSDVRFVKLFGLGLAMAVLVDATLVRAVLVPAFMRLAGEANWWAPAPMRRFHDRFGLSEAETPTPAAVPEPELVSVGSTNGHRRPRPLVAAGREPTSK